MSKSTQLQSGRMRFVPGLGNLKAKIGTPVNVGNSGLSLPWGSAPPLSEPFSMLFNIGPSLDIKDWLTFSVKGQVGWGEGGGYRSL